MQFAKWHRWKEQKAAAGAHDQSGNGSAGGKSERLPLGVRGVRRNGKPKFRLNGKGGESRKNLFPTFLFLPASLSKLIAHNLVKFSVIF